MLEWLETTPIATLLQISVWAYPLVLSMHALGMAIVVGITAIIALRLVGYPSGIPLASFKALAPIWLAGLLINALSGIALFMADATRLFFNTPFQIKIILVAIGVILYWRIDTVILTPASRAAASGNEFNPKPIHRWLGLLALFVWWFSVILSGRLIAYLDS